MLTRTGLFQSCAISSFKISSMTLNLPHRFLASQDGNFFSHFFNGKQKVAQNSCERSEAEAPRAPSFHNGALSTATWEKEQRLEALILIFRKSPQSKK